MPAQASKQHAVAAVANPVLTPQGAPLRAKQRKNTVIAHVTSSVARDSTASLFKTFQQARMGGASLSGATTTAKGSSGFTRPKSSNRNLSLVSFQKRRKPGHNLAAAPSQLQPLQRTAAKPQSSIQAMSMQQLETFHRRPSGLVSDSTAKALREHTKKPSVTATAATTCQATISASNSLPRTPSAAVNGKATAAKDAQSHREGQPRKYDVKQKIALLYLQGNARGPHPAQESAKPSIFKPLQRSKERPQPANLAGTACKGSQIPKKSQGTAEAAGPTAAKQRAHPEKPTGAAGRGSQTWGLSAQVKLLKQENGKLASAGDYQSNQPKGLASKAASTRKAEATDATVVDPCQE